jgi:hypothetical protein
MKQGISQDVMMDSAIIIMIGVAMAITGATPKIRSAFVQKRPKS